MFHHPNKSPRKAHIRRVRACISETRYLLSGCGLRFVTVGNTCVFRVPGRVRLATAVFDHDDGFLGRAGSVQYQRIWLGDDFPLSHDGDPLDIDRLANCLFQESGHCRDIGGRKLLAEDPGLPLVTSQRATVDPTPVRCALEAGSTMPYPRCLHGRVTAACCPCGRLGPEARCPDR